MPVFANRKATSSMDEGDGSGEKGFSASSLTKDLQEIVSSTFDGDLEEVDFDVTAVKSARQQDDWMDWEGADKSGDWDEATVAPLAPVFGDRRVRKKIAPNRPNYPSLSVKLSNNNPFRDDWMKPMIDVEAVRQRLFMPEAEATRLQTEEAIANKFESQQALKFGAFLVGVPIVTSTLVTVSIINPILDKAMATSESFPLSGMQEIEGAHEVHMEETRLRVEAAIGRAPKLNDDEMQAHLRHFALEVLEEKREENRNGLMHLAQDLVTAMVFSLILAAETDGRAYLFRTINRVWSGVSDLGKSFVIILMLDTLVGYHSAEGWESGIRLLARHWNFEPEEHNVYLFVATIPVLMDSLFKLYIFQSFNRKNPAAAVTLKAMDRH